MSSDDRAQYSISTLVEAIYGNLIGPRSVDFCYMWNHGIIRFGQFLPDGFTLMTGGASGSNGIISVSDITLSDIVN